MTTNEQGLIERIEGATGPSFVLDCIIGRLFFPEREIWPAYTASIDAARSLVPAGAPWSINDYCAPKASARVYGFKEAHAVTPALALCAAALKARKAAP